MGVMMEDKPTHVVVMRKIDGQPTIKYMTEISAQNTEEAMLKAIVHAAEKWPDVALEVKLVAELNLLGAGGNSRIVFNADLVDTEAEKLIEEAKGDG